MATPLYVLQALAEVRSSGNINMMDRRGVTMLAQDQRAVEWLDKASDRQYMDALQDMAAAESDDWLPQQEFPGVELDPISGLPEHLFRNDESDDEEHLETYHSGDEDPDDETALPDDRNFGW